LSPRNYFSYRKISKAWRIKAEENTKAGENEEFPVMDSKGMTKRTR
jgi:hypothetical protein